MNIDNQRPKQENKNGFTLIELSIVIIIVGLLVIPLLQMYKVYMIKEEMVKTRANIEGAKSAINLYIGRYPCPSDRSLTPSDANYGLEQCTGITTCTPLSNQGICRTTSLRDADGNGTNDSVIIGGVPFRDSSDTIAGMLASYMVDGWGNKMTYAISENLMILKTNRNSDFKLGVVSAINEHGNPTAGVSDDAQFAIISHGKNGEGTFNFDGVFRPCGTGKIETENCDNDSVFVASLGNYEGTSAGYYDDMSYFYLRAPGELWYNLNTASGGISPHIKNTNTQNIGVNVTTPQYKLDVGGDIQASTVRADNICDVNGTNCVNPTVFNALPAATSGVCPNGQIITSIGNNTATCGNPTLSVSSGSAQCAAGKFITAILTNGCIICNDNNKVCP